MREAVFMSILLAMEARRKSQTRNLGALIGGLNRAEV